VVAASGRGALARRHAERASAVSPSLDFSNERFFVMASPTRRHALLIAALVSISSLFGGCKAQKNGSAESAPSEDSVTLVVAREEGANSLDIQGVGTNRPAYGTSWNVYDRLITHGTKTSPDGQLSYDFERIEPELAERWEVDPEGRFITFFLRKDAIFHDGTPVTAEDVKWSFDRAVSIGGFPTFQMKAGSLERPDQFEVVDTHTFRVRLLRKDKLTLPDLAVPVAAIYNSKLAKRHATPDDPWAQAWLKNNDAGGGAYRVVKFEPGVQEVYQRFEQWKSGPLPRVEKVVVRVIPSASTRRAMLERGDIDVSFDLPPRDAAELLQNQGIKVQGQPIENFMWSVDMNVEKAPFDDVMVRRAIAAALPYDEIIEASCFGRCRPLFGATSSVPATAEWPQPYPYRTDLARAKELLAQSRHPKGFQSKLFLNL
jgi:peptide/nickel transport system substrate-binding protein